MSELSYSRSEKIGHLVAALAKARKAFAPIFKSQSNPYYGSKYADLASLIEATKDALSDNELAVIQLPTNYEGPGVGIETLLIHSSDEWISSRLKMPIQKADAQGVGSAITYGRRYAYGAILNIASEEDDDGNAAAGKANARPGKSTDQGGLINSVQTSAIMSALKSGGRTPRQLDGYLHNLGLEDLEQLPQSEFNTAIKWAFNKGEALQEQLDKSIAAISPRKPKPERVLVPDPEQTQAGD